jgi:hypothetical protein
MKMAQHRQLLERDGRQKEKKSLLLERKTLWLRRVKLMML